MFSIYVGSNSNGDDVIFVAEDSYPNGASVEVASGYETRAAAWADADRAVRAWRAQVREVQNA